MAWICDTRERDLIPKLPSISTRNLPVGDIWIGLSGEDVAPGGVVAERKTVADLEASILDGRYREQKARLLTYCQQVGARPLYIIEGQLDRLGGKFTEDVLRKFLNRLQLRYGVAVIQTDSIDSTANLCRVLLEQWQKDSTVFYLEDGAQKEYSHTVSVSKRANREDPKAFACLVLQQCPGVSAPIASSLIEAFHTLEGVMKASETEMANVKVTEKRRVGPAAAKRLYNLLHAL
jgi:ERCC4-type nuclease